MQDTQAIVFDLDDTLYSERSFVFSGFAAVVQAFHQTLGDKNTSLTMMQSLFSSTHRRTVFNQVLTECGIEYDDSLVNEMIQVYRSHTPTISLHDDARAAIDRLQDRFKLGVITDGPGIMQESKVKSLELENSFNEIILTDHLGDGFAKPHPKAFEEIAKRLDVAASACMYVGDNASKDFVAPNALGWMTVQIRRNDGIYAKELPPRDGHPQAVISSLDELDELL